MKNKIVVSDTNIFLDLISIDLLDRFFELPFKVYTTDFIINEITIPEQKEKIDFHTDCKDIEVVSFNPNDFMEISDLQVNSQTNVSIRDCSVWYYAKKTDSLMLTGDAKLRRVAENDNVKVSGILFIFDNFVEFNVISVINAAKKLEQLQEINPRLPKGECEKRIKLWKGENSV